MLWRKPLPGSELSWFFYCELSRSDETPLRISQKQALESTMPGSAFQHIQRRSSGRIQRCPTLHRNPPLALEALGSLHWSGAELLFDGEHPCVSAYQPLQVQGQTHGHSRSTQQCLCRFQCSCAEKRSFLDRTPPSIQHAHRCSLLLDVTLQAVSTTSHSLQTREWSATPLPRWIRVPL